MPEGIGTSEVKLDATALSELEGAFRGQLVGPGDPGYDEHRKVWNAHPPKARAAHD